MFNNCYSSCDVADCPCCKTNRKYANIPSSIYGGKKMKRKVRDVKGKKSRRLSVVARLKATAMRLESALRIAHP